MHILHSKLSQEQSTQAKHSSGHYATYRPIVLVGASSKHWMVCGLLEQCFPIRVPSLTETYSAFFIYQCQLNNKMLKNKKANLTIIVAPGWLIADSAIALTVLQYHRPFIIHNIN